MYSFLNFVTDALPVFTLTLAALALVGVIVYAIRDGFGFGHYEEF